MVDESAKFGNSFGTQLGGEQNSVKDLIDRCLIATGISTSDTLWRSRALVGMDMVYKQALKGRHWKFSHREAYMNFQEPYTEGTVKLTQNSQEIVESVDIANGAVPIIEFNPATMRGQQFYPTQAEDRYYRIADTGNTNKKLTLVNRFSETSQDFGSYEVLFDHLVMDPKIQQIKSITIPGFGEIRPLGQQSFRELQSAQPSVRKGRPDCFTYGEFGLQASSLSIEVFPAPDQKYPLHIDYIERPVNLQDSLTCFPLIPREHDDVLQFGTMREIYRHQNNEAQRKSCHSDYLFSWGKLASDQEMTDSRARVGHRKNYFAIPIVRAGKRGRGRRRRFDYS